MESHHECPECMKLFASKVIMRLHIAAKHGGVKYNCKQCPKEFKYLSALHSHLKRRHTITSAFREDDKENVAEDIIEQEPPIDVSGADPEMRKLVQHQLILLLHARRCQARDQKTTENGGQVAQCTLPHCLTMRNVLSHMASCKSGKLCGVAHCSSSWQMLTHWSKCKKLDCSFCAPIKEADKKEKVSVRDVRTISASAARLSSRMCLILSGPILPPKTTNAKAVVAKLIKRHLSYCLSEKEIVDCSYLGKTNSIVLKFTKVGKGSDHENIISQCRKLSPDGICVNIMEASCDSGMYFLLGCMQATGQISGYYTARSGKPAAFLEDGPTEFGSEAEVRRIMNAESEEEARRRDAGNPSRKEERKRGVEDITNKISNMINMKLELKQK